MDPFRPSPRHHERLRLQLRERGLERALGEMHHRAKWRLSVNGSVPRPLAKAIEAMEIELASVRARLRGETSAGAESRTAEPAHR